MYKNYPRLETTIDRLVVSFIGIVAFMLHVKVILIVYREKTNPLFVDQAPPLAPPEEMPGEVTNAALAAGDL